LVSEPAQGDIVAAYEWLVERSPLHAPLWHNGLLDAIIALEKTPPAIRLHLNQNSQLKNSSVSLRKQTARISDSLLNSWQCRLDNASRTRFPQ
jgi:hypothetical protein